MSTYIHVVLFTFQEDTPETEVESIIQAAAGLSAIPTVRRLDCGRRDEAVQRPVSDTSYDVGLLVCFDDKSGCDLYSTHPTHLALWNDTNRRGKPSEFVILLARDGFEYLCDTGFMIGRHGECEHQKNLSPLGVWCGRRLMAWSTGFTST